MNSQGSERLYSESCSSATSDSIELDDDSISDSLSETVERLIFGKKSLKRARARNDQVGMGDILKVRLQNTLNRQEGEMKNFTVEMDRYMKIEKAKIDLEYRKLDLEGKKFGYQQMRMEIEKAKVDLKYKKLDLEYKRLDLEEKKFRHQQREDELNFMFKETSSLDEVEKRNIDLLRAQIVARMLQK